MGKQRIVFSTRGKGTAGYSQAKELICPLILCNIQKLTQNRGKTKIRTKTIKLLQENISVNFFTLD